MPSRDGAATTTGSGGGGGATIFAGLGAAKATTVAKRNAPDANGGLGLRGEGLVGLGLLELLGRLAQGLAGRDGRVLDGRVFDDGSGSSVGLGDGRRHGRVRPRHLLEGGLLRRDGGGGLGLLRRLLAEQLGLAGRGLGRSHL